MCKPVMPKNVAPNNGDAFGHSFNHSFGTVNGRSPSSIRCFHSNRCSTMNVTPKRMVNRIHFLTAFLFPRADAETPIIIVKLEVRRHRVMTVVKMMLGLNGYGVGFRCDYERTLAYPMSS